MADDEFVLVTKRHRLCAKRKKKYSSLFPCVESGHHINNDTTLRKDLLHQRLLERKYEIQTANSLKIDCQELSRVEEVVCYGIGKISDNITAQYQLAVLLLLIETLLNKVKQVFIYDPVLEDGEIEFLSQLGLQYIITNEYCRRIVNVPTLFYMPHCGLSLYNNLLYANWSPDLLMNVFIIGNSFSTYLTRLTSSELDNKAFYLNQLRDVYIEHNVSLRLTDDSVLNDTSVHIFPESLIKALSPTVWTQHTEPPYDDEMII